MQEIDPDLIDYMDHVPARFNQKIVQGYSANIADELVDYLDQILEVASKSFKDNDIPLVFEPCSYVTPEQRVAEETRPINNKCTYEITRSDYRTIRVNLRLTNTGERLIPKYLKVNFIDGNGMFRLSGVSYHVTPTFMDELFSVDKGSIFMQVTRARFKFMRTAYNFMANGTLIFADYFWGKLYHKKGNEAPKTRHPQLLNYILAEHGFTETFKRLFGITVHYGGVETFNDIDYPEDEWVICSSAGNRPRGRIYNNDFSTQLRLAIRKEDFESQPVRSALCSIFYIADICGDLAAFDYRDFDDPYMWQRILARFIWKVEDEVESLALLDDHLRSIGEYVDALVVVKLRRLKINAMTINEVFAYVINHFNSMVIDSDVGDMSKKRLSVVDNLMFPAQIMIFKILFALLKKSKDFFQYDMVNRLLAHDWRSRVLLSINSKHKEIQVLESTTDQKVYKLGRAAEFPSKHTASQKAAEMRDPSFFLHPSMAYITSYTFITKSSPTGRGSLNIFAQTDNSGHFIRDPRLNPILNNLEELMGYKKEVE